MDVRAASRPSGFSPAPFSTQNSGFFCHIWLYLQFSNDVFYIQPGQSLIYPAFCSDFWTTGLLPHCWLLVGFFFFMTIFWESCKFPCSPDAAVHLHPRTPAAPKKHLQSVDNLSPWLTVTDATAETITCPHSWECGICLNTHAESAGKVFFSPCRRSGAAASVKVSTASQHLLPDFRI